MITTNLHKYEISLSNGASIQINETICNPPLQFGRVNPFIVSRISDYYSNDTPFLFLDFTSSQLTKKIPFNYINKKNIDDLAIFLPNSNRAVGLSNGNILSQCIIANNLLEHFDYKLIKSDFTEFFNTLKFIYGNDVQQNKQQSFLYDLLRFPMDAKYLEAKFGKLQNPDIINDFWIKNIGPIYNIPEFKYNPFILRSFLNGEKSGALENLYTVVLLDLDKLSLFNCKWIAETVLITYLHNFILKRRQDGLSIFIIDDDIGIIDLKKILNTALINFDQEFKGVINIFIQKGTSFEYSAELYPAPNYPRGEIALKLIELSNLKNGIDIDSYFEYFAAYTNCKSDKWENGDLIEFLIKDDYNKIGKNHAYRNLIYDLLPDSEEHNYPLGAIESLKGYI